MLRYGTTSGNLNQSSSVGELALDHSLTLTNLLPGTIYYFSAEATDSSSNTATSVVGSFTTTGRIDGVCGSSNNGTFASEPAINLCSAGTASAVSGTGPWTWTCAGLNNGTTANCSAQVCDTIPNAFTFTDQTGATLNTEVTSNTITVAGITCAAPVSITNGTYSVNNGAYTSATGSVNNGDTIAVRVTSSGNYLTLTTATLTIGGTSDLFSVTTQATPVNGVCGSSNNGTFATAPAINLCSAGAASAVSGTGPWTWTCAGLNNGTTANCSAQVCDTIPNAFIFTDQTGTALNTQVTSNTITVAGITCAASVSITNGTYSLNNAAYTSATGSVNNGDTVAVRVTSSGSYGTLITATLTIGGTSDLFSVTTVSLNPPVVSGTTPTTNTRPTWTWISGGVGGSGVFRFKLDNNSLSSGTTETTALTYTPTADLTEGSHILYVQERDATGNWSPSGNKVIVINAIAPTIGSLTPTPVTTEQGKPQTFTAIYRDANGYTNLKSAYLLVSSSGSRTNAIWSRYDRAANKLYLYNDAGTATVSGSCTPGQSATLANTQGALNCVATTVSVAGNNLTVRWNLTPKLAFASTTAKQVRMNVKDNSGLTTGWMNKGSWTITATNTAPTLGTLTPTPITTEQGKPQTFTAIYSDADGYANLNVAFLKVSPTGSATNAIWTRYDRAANKLYLYNDAGTGIVSGSCAPGQSTTLENSQGILNCGQTTVANAGSNLTIKWNLTPKPAFASTTAKQMRMNVKDNSGLTTGWVKKGSWTITAGSSASALDELTPQAFRIFHYGIMDAAPASSYEDEVLDRDNDLGISLEKEMSIIDNGFLNRPDDITLNLAVKKSDGITTEDLDGTYSIVQHTVIPDQAEDPDPVVVQYEFHFDGQGSVLITLLDQAEKAHAFQKNATYAIKPDGSITIPGFAGQLSPNGELMVLVADRAGTGKKGTPSRPAILIGMKQATGKNLASLTGEYDMSGIMNTLVNSSTEWSRQQDLVSFDGQGFCYSPAENTGVYSVAGDGIMTVFGMEGIVSADNRWLLIIDTDKSDGDLGISIGELR